MVTPVGQVACRSLLQDASVATHWPHLIGCASLAALGDSQMHLVAVRYGAGRPDTENLDRENRSDFKTVGLSD
jgi:hypothetical protein